MLVSKSLSFKAVKTSKSIGNSNFFFFFSRKYTNFNQYKVRPEFGATQLPLCRIVGFCPKPVCLDFILHQSLPQAFAGNCSLKQKQ